MGPPAPPAPVALAPPPPAPRCCCAHKRRASPLTCLAVCFLVLTYNLLGGFLFLALEGTAPAEETAVAASKPNLSQPQGNDLRARTVERLWSITEDLNILYKENWTKLAAKELMDFQKILLKSVRGGAVLEARPSIETQRWTFSGSFLYALTLITTIGHGNVTPRSSVGKAVAVAYACVGIPIIMLYLATSGEALARRARGLYGRVWPGARRGRPAGAPADFKQFSDCDKGDKLDTHKRTPFQAALNLDSFGSGYHWKCTDHTRVPILLSLFLIALYVALGTLVFHSTERWDVVDGCYFSFASLATIGFGELRPGLYASTISAKAEDVAVGVCCVYILVGIVVIAMCFNLIQEELSGILRGWGARAVHSAELREDKRAPRS